MKQSIFLIHGYGVPQDILKDDHYSFYLKMVFNAMFDIAQKNKSTKNYIILSGGKTDCFEPFTRTEAGEMQRFFVNYLASKPYLNKFIETLVFIPEPKALSSLENLINERAIIEKRKLNGPVYIFTEKTRGERIKKTAKKVFGKMKVVVVPIDFDISQLRYLDLGFLREKEKKAFAFEMWSLKSPENMKKHHELFKKKIAYLRKAGTKEHAEAIKKWWEEQLEGLK